MRRARKRKQGRIPLSRPRCIRPVTAWRGHRRMLPPCVPPRQTVYAWFAVWRDAGSGSRSTTTWLSCESSGRDASPSVAVVDSQSVKTTEAGGPRGYDAGKKIKGHKRHAMVDTDGCAPALQSHSLGVRSRGGAIPLLKASMRRFPFFRYAYVDTAYAAERVAAATGIAIEVVGVIPGRAGFEVHPCRWMIERCSAWLNRNRRWAMDLDATIAYSNAFHAKSLLFLQAVLCQIHRHDPDAVILPKSQFLSPGIRLRSLLRSKWLDS